MRRKAKAIELDDAQRKKLMKLAHSNTAQVRLARRAGIVLLAADGLDNHEIGEMLDVGRVQAGRWRVRYAVGGVKAIAQDLPRGGRKPKIDPAEIFALRESRKLDHPIHTWCRSRRVCGRGSWLGVSHGVNAAQACPSCGIGLRQRRCNDHGLVGRLANIPCA